MKGKSKYFLVFITLSVGLKAQLPKWILGSSEQETGGSFHPYGSGNLNFYEVNFAGGLTSTQRTIGSSIQNIKSIGTQDVVQTAVDTANTVLFYAFIASVGPYNAGFPAIKPDTVYFAAYNPTTAADEIIGKVPTDGWGASVIESELVKKPGSSTEYFFIYKTQASSQFFDNIKYVTINTITKTVSAPSYIVTSTKSGEGMAVSQLSCVTNQRWLFVTRPESNGDITLRRCAITNSGISAPTDIYTVSIPGNSIDVVAAVEIAPTNNFLAIANYNNAPVSKNMILFDYNNSTGVVSNERSYTNQSTYDFVTMEFSPDGSRVYIMQGGSGSFPNIIYNCPVVNTNYTVTAANQITGMMLDNSLTLELAYDGNIYVNPGQSSGFMYVINNPNSATANVTSTASNFFGTNQHLGSAFPDQIDGDRNSSGGTTNISITPTTATICVGQTTVLTATGASSYTWSEGSTNASINVSPNNTTTYSVQSVNGVCINSASVVVNVTAPISATFSYSYNGCSSPNVAFASASTSGNLLWSFGDGTNSTSLNPSHAYQAGNYQVTLITNPNTACADTTSQSIATSALGQNQIIPNVFTPNKDGINDELIFSGLDCADYELEIYNRWGLKVFETDKPQTVFWDGAININHEVVDGFYYYLLIPKNSNTATTIKGNILVIR